MRIHFQNVGMKKGINFQKFDISMSIHFGSWAAHPYPKLGQVPSPLGQQVIIREE